VVVPAGVDSNLPQPSPHGAIAAELVDLAEGFEQHVLNHVLNIRLVHPEGTDQRQKRLILLVDERIPGRPIAGAQGGKERAFLSRARLTRLAWLAG